MSDSKANYPFEVFVDDNFHYQDETERYKFGEYQTYEEAVTACKEIVDSELSHLYEKGVSATELYASYTSFGEDPFIKPAPHEGRFSAWEYARERCEKISSGKSTKSWIASIFSF